MGKISMGSIAFLQKDEISFLKACAGKNISALRYFTKKGVNVNLLDEDRTSPLHVASRSGSLQVVEELINSGATVNMADMAGWTPLHVAAYYQRPLICHLLLKKGADAYLMSRQGETPWDMVREKSTEEIFFSHFDRTELRKMSKLRREEPYSDVNDEYIVLSEYKPKESTFRTKHEIEIRESVVPKEGSTGKKLRSGMMEENETKPHTENFRNLIDMNLTQNVFTTHQNQRMTSMEDPYFGERKSHFHSMAPKKHKYYIYFKKMKAQQMSSFRENREILNTLNSEASSDGEGEHLIDYSYNNEMGYSPKQARTKPHEMEDIIGSKNQAYSSVLGDLPLVIRKMDSINNSGRNLSPEKKSARLMIPGSEPRSQSQLVPNNQRLVSHQGSVNNSFAKVPSISKIERSNISVFPLVNPTISIYKLFYKDPRETVLSKLDEQTTGNIIGDFVDLSLFEIDEKYRDQLYKIGIELFNYDGTTGISFLILFKFLRQSVKDIALFLYSDETQGSIKKSLHERTNFLANLQIRECLEILQHYSAFFHFEDMGLLEALRLYLSCFIIENDPEKIDWLLRGFSRRYFRTMKKLVKNAQPLPNKQKFETIEAVRMLCFTLVMLDIEINHPDKGAENPINYEEIRRELQCNLSGVNDGENFSPSFINNLFEEIKREKLIKYIGHNDVSNKAKLSFKFAKLMIRGSRNSKKNKDVQKDYLMYFAGPVCFVIKFLGDKSIPKGAFMLNGCSVSYAESKSPIRMTITKPENLIPFVHFKNSGTTIVSFKQEFSINVTNLNDILRIKEHVKSIN